jgi:mannitol-specific phosphotransferase system IIBC component
MPLHFGKIFAAIALITIGAFIAWLLFTSLFATEQAGQKIEKTGAASSSLHLGVAT